MFADNSSLIEHYWMPNWESESINDPSATYLKAHGFRKSENKNQAIFDFVKQYVKENDSGDFNVLISVLPVLLRA